MQRYISRKTLYKNDNCLFRRHPRTPASCDTVVLIQSWTRNEKIGSKKKKHEYLAAKHLNFDRALDKFVHTAHYKELTETGNRA